MKVGSDIHRRRKQAMTDNSLKREAKIYIDLQALFFTCAAMFFLIPPIVENIVTNVPHADATLNIARILFVLMMLVFSLTRKTLKLTTMEIALIVFAIWGFIVTLVHASERLFQYSGSVFFKIIAMIFLVNNMTNGKEEKTISGIAHYFTALIWINAVLMILFPHGLFMSSVGAVVKRANWIFGSKNNVTLYAIVVLCVLYLDNLSSKRMFNYITVAIFAVEIACMGSNGVEVFGGSTTALFVLFIFGFVLFARDMAFFQLLERKVTLRCIALFSICLCLLVWHISLNRSGWINTILSDVLNVFGKDTTFSERDIVWNNLLQFITRHPFVGHGFCQFWFPMGIHARSSSMYSFWGSIVFYYGIIGLSILLIAFFLCERDGRDNRNEKQILVFKLGMMLVMMFGLVNEIHDWVYLIFLMELYNHSETLNVNCSSTKRIRLKFRRTAYALQPIPIRQESHTIDS